MKMVLIMPVLAAALFTVGCDEDSNPTALIPETTASVRFFNATTDLATGGFTTNGQFTTGSALGFGQPSATCTKFDAGTASFAFGAANSSGTAIGTPLGSLNNQSLAAGGNYTVVAVGRASNPTLVMFDNKLTHSLGANEAAIRFVNLAPGTDTIANKFFVYQNATVGQGTQVGKNMVVGEPTAFEFVPSGANQYAVLKLPGLITAVEGSAGLLNLTAGTAYTFAILPQLGGWRLLNIPRC